MARFKYNAVDAQGNAVGGDVEAASLELARAELLARGWRDLVLTQQHVGLSADEAQQLSSTVAELSSASLPLESGLRAVAAETPNARLAGALRSLADRLERGQSLSQALDSMQEQLPRYIRGLMAAADRSGRLPQVLGELVECQQAERDTHRTVVAALAYPSIVLLLSLAVFVLFQLFVVQPYREMYEEFELSLPLHVQIVFWWSDVGVWVLIALAAIGVILILAVPLIAGAARWRRIISTLPLIGALWRWSGVAELSRLLGLMLQYQVPLPEALKLTADGVRDAHIRNVCLVMADQVDQGQSLSSILQKTYSLPASLIPMVAWGEKTGTLDQALRASAEMFDGRVRLRSHVMKAVYPPLVFVIVLIVLAFLFISLLLPLFTLISGLA